MALTASLVTRSYRDRLIRSAIAGASAGASVGTLAGLPGTIIGSVLGLAFVPLGIWYQHAHTDKHPISTVVR